MSDLLAKLAALKKVAATPVPQQAVPDATAASVATPTKPAQPSLPQINTIVKQADVGDTLMKDLIQEARGVPQQLDVKEIAHQEVRNTIKDIESMLGANHPLLPNCLTKVKRIVKEHDSLAWELSKEEVGIISKACIEASRVVLAEKAVKSRGKSSAKMTMDDLL